MKCRRNLTNKTMKADKLNSNWRLASLEISFQKGYDWEKEPEKQNDRYEGTIKFENNERESFLFKVKPNMAQKYIDLIADDIVSTATNLGEKLIESLG